MRNPATIAAMVILVVSSFVPCHAASVRIASWNLNNLHFISGEALRARAPVRGDDDFTILQQYERRLDADIVALQEVNGPRAARRLFSGSNYDVYFSGRYDQDAKTGRPSDRIYTGFAIRKNVFDSVTKVDYSELSVPHGKPSRPTRWGVMLKVELEGKVLYLLNVHLKSGCFRGNLVRPKRSDCITLAKQVDPLESWIDRHAKLHVPFIVLGDFNRTFDVYQENDHIWEELDDGDPVGLRLLRLPHARKSTCWSGTPLYHPNPVDFFLFNRQAWRKVSSNSFTEFDYDEKHRNSRRRTPSDHCPILIQYDL